MDTNTAMFQQLLNKLAAYEAQGLRWRLVLPDGTTLDSLTPLPTTVEKVPLRTNINRSICITDLFREEVKAMKVGEVLTLKIPPAHAHEITPQAWLKTMSSFGLRIFGAGNVTTASLPGGGEIMRLK
jgi:hypothetical protein